MSRSAKSRTTPEERRGWAVALAALLASRTLDGAARRAGVSAKTLRRWLGHPVFARKYREERAKVVEHVVARLQQASGLAVEALEDGLKTGLPADRVRAARAILDHATKGLELYEIIGRVDELERLLEASEPRSTGDA